MSLLVNNTLANPTASFYAANGSGGGGGNSSNLQSPASILPGPTGDLILTMPATPGAGNNSALIIDANGGDAYIFMNAGPGASTGYKFHATNVGAGNTLQIGGQVAAFPMIELNNPNHTLTLGDGNAASVVDVPAATILLDASLASTVATGGIVTADVNGVTIETSANKGITVSNAQTTIVGNYKYVQTLGTINTNTSIPINPPTQTGLYSIMMGTTSTDAYSVQACLSVDAYFLDGTGFVAGGNGYAVLNGTSGGTEFAQLYTNAGVINFKYVAVATPTITNMFCRVIQLTGDLGF
jgi:hypothetical protein